MSGGERKVRPNEGKNERQKHTEEESGPHEPEVYSALVSREQAGNTLAALVRELARERKPETSWKEARELCRRGAVRVDGDPESEETRRLKAGQRIELNFKSAEGGSSRHRLLPPGAIVHCDSELVVVRKPAGLLTVPFEDDDRDTLVHALRPLLNRLGFGKAPLRVVQRLDKETSGLLVFARTLDAERHLQQQLRRHSVIRRYQAIVHGTAESATYDTLLVPDRGDGLRGSWDVFRAARGEPPATARHAVTHVELAEPLQGASLVSCRLETGRQHQIRIHLAEAGHPLVGERVYIRNFKGEPIAAPRPMLHAAELGFVHPRDGRERLYQDPLPEDFVAVLGRLRRLQKTR
jgi:23S rRNA pseudouridine1911/1915/1917 synthase